MFLLKHWKLLIVPVLAFMGFLYLENKVEETRELIRLENRVEQQQDYIEGRKGIDNATKSVRGIDSDAALEWLRNRTPRGE